MASKQYYDISKVLSTNSEYIMLLGQRANGKSFQAKKTVLENAFKNHRRFIYLRRWAADIKQNSVTAYFDDMPILSITKGRYSGVQAYQGYIYFTFLDEEDNLQRSTEPIGRYCALNEAERYKSQAFVDYDYLLYEEFITDGLYLNNEATKLMQFVSTVARDRRMTILLIGNTLSRVCPYFEWVPNVLKQKIGTIEIYNYHVGEDTIQIAVEYCANAGGSNKMFFGTASKQIVSGEWDTVEVPKLPKDYKMYVKGYELCIEYQKFKFILELLIDDTEGSAIVFIYPLTTSRNVYRLITDKASSNPLINNRLNPDIKPEALMINCFRNNKVFYSDNLTGSDFKNVIAAYNFI